MYIKLFEHYSLHTELEKLSELVFRSIIEKSIKNANENLEFYKDKDNFKERKLFELKPCFLHIDITNNFNKLKKFVSDYKLMVELRDFGSNSRNKGYFMVRHIPDLISINFDNENKEILEQSFREGSLEEFNDFYYLIRHDDIQDLKSTLIHELKMEILMIIKNFLIKIGKNI